MYYLCVTCVSVCVLRVMRVDSRGLLNALLLCLFSDVCARILFTVRCSYCDAVYYELACGNYIALCVVLVVRPCALRMLIVLVRFLACCVTDSLDVWICCVASLVVVCWQLPRYACVFLCARVYVHVLRCAIVSYGYRLCPVRALCSEVFILCVRASFDCSEYCRCVECCCVRCSCCVYMCCSVVISCVLLWLRPCVLGFVCRMCLENSGCVSAVCRCMFRMQKV